MLVVGAGIVGAAAAAFPSEPADEAETAEALFDAMRRMFRGGRSLEPAFRGIAGRPVPGDRLPVAGALPGAEGVYVAAMDPARFAAGG